MGLLNSVPYIHPVLDVQGSDPDLKENITKLDQHGHRIQHLKLNAINWRDFSFISSHERNYSSLITLELININAHGLINLGTRNKLLILQSLETLKLIDCDRGCMLFIQATRLREIVLRGSLICGFKLNVSQDDLINVDIFGRSIFGKYLSLLMRIFLQDTSSQSIASCSSAQSTWTRVCDFLHSQDYHDPELNFKDCPFENDISLVLSKIRTNPNIQTLNLVNTGLDYGSQSSFLDFFHQNETLQSLLLNNNVGLGKCMASIFQGLSINSSLTHLDISGIPLSSESQHSLAKLIRHSRKLHIKFDSCSLPSLVYKPSSPASFRRLDELTPEGAKLIFADDKNYHTAELLFSIQPGFLLSKDIPQTTVISKFQMTYLTIGNIAALNRSITEGPLVEVLSQILKKILTSFFELPDTHQRILLQGPFCQYYLLLFYMENHQEIKAPPFPAELAPKDFPNPIIAKHFGHVRLGVAEEIEYALKPLALKSPAVGASTSVSKSDRQIKKTRRELLHSLMFNPFHHPNIIQSYGVWRDHLVLEKGNDNWTMGVFLELNKYHPSMIRYADKLAYDILSALEFLHTHFVDPLAHCDLKPENILLTKTAKHEFIHAKLLDFETTRAFHGIVTDFPKSLRSPVYQPPDARSDSLKSVDPKVDIWAFGLVYLQLKYPGKAQDLIHEVDRQTKSTSVPSERIFLTRTAKMGVRPEDWERIKDCFLFHEARPTSSVLKGRWPKVPKSIRWEDCCIRNWQTPAMKSSSFDLYNIISDELEEHKVSDSVLRFGLKHLRITVEDRQDNFLVSTAETSFLQAYCPLLIYRANITFQRNHQKIFINEKKIPVEFPFRPKDFV